MRLLEFDPPHPGRGAGYATGLWMTQEAVDLLVHNIYQESGHLTPLGSSTLKYKGVDLETLASTRQDTGHRLLVWSGTGLRITYDPRFLQLTQEARRNWHAPDQDGNDGARSVVTFDTCDDSTRVLAASLKRVFDGQPETKPLEMYENLAAAVVFTQIAELFEPVDDLKRYLVCPPPRS